MTDFYSLGLTLDSSGALRGWGQVTNAATQYGRASSAALNTSDQAMRLVAQSTGQTAVAMRNLSMTAQNTLGTLAQMGRMLGIALGVREVMQAAQSWQMLEAKIRIVTKGKADAADMMERLYQASQRTRTSMSATADLFTRVARSAGQLGKSLDDIMRFTETVQQAVMLSGASTSEATNGVIQLGQALASGRLQGDEFRSIMENLGGVAYYMAKGLGTTTKGLYEMRTAGTLTAKAIVEAMLKMQAEIEEDFGMLPQTMEQSLAKIRNSFMKAAKGFEDQTALAETFSRVLDGVANNMDKIATSMKHVAVLWAAITATKFTKTLSGGIENMQKATGAALQTGRDAAIEARHQASLARGALLQRDYALAEYERLGADRLLAKSEVELTAIEKRRQIVVETVIASQNRLNAATVAGSAASKVAAANANIFTIAIGRAALAGKALLAAWWPLLAFTVAFEGLMHLWNKSREAKKALAAEAQKAATALLEVAEAVQAVSEEIKKMHREMDIDVGKLDLFTRILGTGGDKALKEVQKVWAAHEAGLKAVEKYKKANPGVEDMRLLGNLYTQTKDKALAVANAEERLSDAQNKRQKATEELNKIEGARISLMDDAIARAMNELETRMKSIAAYDREAAQIREMLTGRKKTAEQMALITRLRDLDLKILISRDPAERAALQRLRDVVELMKQRTEMTRVLNKIESEAGERRRKDMEETRNKIIDTMTVSKALNEAMLEGVRSIQNVFANLFSDIFRDGQLSFKRLSDSILEIISNMVASIAATMTIKAIGLDKLMKAIEKSGDPNSEHYGKSMRQLVNDTLGKKGGMALAGVGGLAAGYGMGQTVYGMTGSKTMGALGGAAAGAAMGFSVGGPIGAAIGGVAGFVGGIIGAGKAASEAAKRIKTLRESFQNTLSGLRAEMSGDTLAQWLSQEKERFVQLRKQTEEAYAGTKAEAERERILKELNQREATRLEQLKEEFAMKVIQVNGDLRVRSLMAQGRNEEAEGLRMSLKWQEEYAAALRDWGTTHPEIVAALQETIDLERKRYEEMKKFAKEQWQFDLGQRGLRALGKTAQAGLLATQWSQRLEMDDLVKGGASENDVAALAIIHQMELLNATAEMQRELLGDLIAETEQAYYENLNVANLLKDYLKGLNFSNLSVLGPEQQFGLAKSDLLDLFNKAQAGDLGAAGQLPDAANRFLELARIMYASTDGYVAAFNLVNEMLGKIGAEASERATVEEKLLDTLYVQAALGEKANDLLTQQLEALWKMYDVLVNGPGYESGDGVITKSDPSAPRVGAEDTGPIQTKVVVDELKLHTQELNSLVKITYAAARENATLLAEVRDVMIQTRDETKTARLAGPE